MMNQTILDYNKAIKGLIKRFNHIEKAKQDCIKFQIESRKFQKRITHLKLLRA